MTEPLKLLDLFSGIGGFSLGLERSGGFKTVAFCEIEPFPRAVLAKHWPEVPCYDDVRTLTAARLAADGIAVDAICGGFPCQDISVAGNQAGIGEGTRSGLWSEIARLVGELRPRVVIVENVANLLSGPSGRPGGWFGAVLGDLAALGYDAEWHCIPASAVGAPHQRDRIWIVANAKQQRPAIGTPRGCSQECVCDELGNCAERQKQFGIAGYAVDLPDANQPRLQGWIGPALQGRGVAALHPWAGSWWATESGLGRVAHGVPKRVDRLKALGNAVVPQIPELIGRAIMASMVRA